MKRFKQNFILMLALLALAAFFLCSCGEEEKKEESGYRVYYLNKDATALVYDNFELKSDKTTEMLTELLSYLADSGDWDRKAPLSFGFTVTDCVLDNNQIKLTVDEHYTELPPTTEILVRAALVRTLLQPEEAVGLTMFIGDEELKDTKGNPIGIMTADSFIDNEGVEINSYQEVNLTLYFATESGTALCPVPSTVVYNTNVSMERLVVEQIINGPEDRNTYATVDPSTKVISVTVTDGVCFVNLSSDFLNPVGFVTPEVTIYSIVNSLAELNGIRKVQFHVNGESKIVYREIVDLENPLARNLDIVEK
ncbi:MAG: GerMN domain-containing protein [Lachnospiraceae bacterium]|nr:GerMN domain-containing protein [Lachnospiraceae bacterium]